jgi:hypothetical protein
MERIRRLRVPGYHVAAYSKLALLGTIEIPDEAFKNRRHSRLVIEDVGKLALHSALLREQAAVNQFANL